MRCAPCLPENLKSSVRALRKRFLEFFGGGQASLELEDPDDILNSGIEIKVQPPGKSLKTLTLLSGGEKAFTAISLYFAILKVKPTPFVFMDEIEAALDEANIQRFAMNMRKMSSKTQMLIITHHRRDDGRSGCFVRRDHAGAGGIACHQHRSGRSRADN